MDGGRPRRPARGCPDPPAVARPRASTGRGRLPPAPRAWSLQLGVLGVEGSELVAEHVADLSDGAASAECFPHRWKEVLVSAGDTADLGETPPPEYRTVSVSAPVTVMLSQALR